MQPTAFRDAAFSRRVYSGSAFIGLDRLGKFWHFTSTLLSDDRKALQRGLRLSHYPDTTWPFGA